MRFNIPYNKPHLTGEETNYIIQAVQSGKISGDGLFTQKCHAFFEQTFGFGKCLLTTSCTDALEMAAILIRIQPGDEVIMPSYTFVSTANAFVLRGAKIVFADSRADQPGIDEQQIASLITPKTKAIVPVHYAGVACDMEPILSLAKKHQLYVIEDAAQAIDSYYTFSDGSNKPLGGIGDLGTFSFHETKNIQSGEGGLLAISNSEFQKRAEIIREKGTNRSAFFRGEIDKYGWVDIGSSFLPSDIIAAFLYAQLESLQAIQQKRLKLWQSYYSQLKPLEEKGHIKLPVIPSFATNNAHMFYILCANLNERTALIDYLKAQGINAVFHYLSLHTSSFFELQHDGRNLPNSDYFSDCLLRLPMYFELTESDVERISVLIHSFYKTA